MLRRWMPFLLILISAMPVMGTVSRQEEEPEAAQSAYLFNHWTYELVRLGLDGSHTSYTLRDDANPAVEQVWNLQLNHDATQAYYCFSRRDSQTGESTTRFVAQNLASGTTIFEVELPCWISHLLSEDGNRIVVGARNQGSDRPTWHLSVLDTSTGEIVSQLASDPALEGLDLPAWLTPIPIRFVENLVEFVAVPAPSDPPFIGPLYRFDLATHAVSTIQSETSASATILPATDEIIWPAHDPRHPAGKQGTGAVYATNNVLQEALPNEMRTIFYSPDELIFEASFINDGKHLAIALLEPLSESGEWVSPAQGIRWVALDRQGSITPLTDYLGGSPMVTNAPGGYLLLHRDYSSPDMSMSQATLSFHGMGGEAVELWTAAGNAGDAFGWELVWSAPATVPVDLPIFPAVQPK